MKKSVDIEKFEKRLGYTFKDPKYLLEALTHPSFLQRIDLTINGWSLLVIEFWV